MDNLKKTKKGATLNLNSAGSALLEVLFGVSVVSIVLLSLLGAYSVYLKNSFRLTEKIQASFLAEEGVEAIRVIRDSSFNIGIDPLVSNTPYYFSFEDGTWKATTTSVVIDGQFWRTFKIFAVNRDSNDDIVTSGGANDPNTKMTVVTVSWNSGGATSTISISTYLTNLFSN